MALDSGLRRFYIILGVIVVGGAAAMLMQGGGDDLGGPVSNVPVGASFSGYVIGSDSAPVEIVEYADFQCPACARHAVLTMPDVMSRLVATGRVRWVFRDFPLDSHRNSRSAHTAAACADEQGQFWAMHDQLFFGQNAWALERRPKRKYLEFARTIRLDEDKFDDCIDSRRLEWRAGSGIQEGLAAGVVSTPSFLIQGTLYAGTIPYDRIKQLVDSIAPISE